MLSSFIFAATALPLTALVEFSLTLWSTSITGMSIVTPPCSSAVCCSVAVPRVTVIFFIASAPPYLFHAEAVRNDDMSVPSKRYSSHFPAPVSIVIIIPGLSSSSMSAPASAATAVSLV